MTRFDFTFLANPKWLFTKALHLLLFFPEEDIVPITFNAVSSVKLISNLKPFALGSGLCLQKYSAERLTHTWRSCVTAGVQCVRRGQVAVVASCTPGLATRWPPHPGRLSRRCLHLLRSAHFSVVLARGHALGGTGSERGRHRGRTQNHGGPLLLAHSVH